MADNKDAEQNTSHINENELPEMTSNKEEEEEEAQPRGNDWEVVSLTASTYAAAPGPRGHESIYKENDPTVSKDYEAETSRALFMSGHFVFPPSQHENLPIEPENFRNTKLIDEYEPTGDMNVATLGKAEQKEEENWSIEGKNLSEYTGIPLLEHKGDHMMSIHGSRFDEPDISGTQAFGESIVVNDLLQPSNDAIDPSPFISKPPEPGKDNEVDDSNLPCGAWWKRRVLSLCAQVKDTNTFWSLFVSAAVMGLVVLGQHWQQGKWQLLEHRWQLTIGDEVLLLVTL